MNIKRGQMWKADQNTDNTGKDSTTSHSEQPCCNAAVMFSLPSLANLYALSTHSHQRQRTRMQKAVEVTV